LPTVAQRLEPTQDTPDLYRFPVSMQIADTVKTRTVNIPEWQMKQQVAHCENTELGAQRIGALRTNSLQVFNV